MEAELRSRWQRVVGFSPAAGAAFEQLLARYREPHRRYHTAKHVLEVLRVADELLQGQPAGPPVDADAVRLAVFFHDAVYDPASPGNEAASARLAAEVLAGLGVDAGRIAAVARLVEATATHAAGALDEAIVIDADLAILGERPAVYDAYVNGVRAEYAHVPDDAWRTGRAAVLQGFLDRPRIFTTDAARAAREARARANLTAELQTLSGPGTTRSPGHRH